jgi:hypothetical protein
MAPTKAELQTQLRELNRGFPRLPVSTMKMHELEAAIDAAKKMKESAMAALETKAPALPGPKGPREIEVNTVQSGPTTIRVPKAPAEKTIGVPKGKKPGKAITIEDPEHDELLPAVKTAGPPKKIKSAPVSTHFCNCPSCPAKKA